MLEGHRDIVSKEVEENLENLRGRVHRKHFDCQFGKFI